MKKIFTFRNVFVFLLVTALISVVAFDKQGWAPVRYFSRSGEMTRDNIRVFRDTITCNNGQGFAIDMSAAGFTLPPAITITPALNTVDSMEVPNVALKTLTSTTATVNVTQGNRAGLVAVALIGLTVVSGPPQKFTRTPVVLHVAAIGK